MEYRISDPEIAKLIKNKKKSSRPEISDVQGEDKSINTNSVNSKTVMDEKNEKDFYNKFKAKPNKSKRKKLKPPSTKNLAVATKQLASMIKTGLPLLESLSILSDSTEDKSLKHVFKEASISISRGSTFLSILQSFPEIFDDMYLALVSAGEEAGLLPNVLERESKLLESLAKIKGQINSALAYPIAIFTLTVIVIIVMLLFVIPVFTQIYADSGTKLPMLTNMLVVA